MNCYYMLIKQQIIYENTNNLILKHYLAMMIMQRRAFKSLGWS